MLCVTTISSIHHSQLGKRKSRSISGLAKWRVFLDSPSGESFWTHQVASRSGLTKWRLFLDSPSGESGLLCELTTWSPSFQTSRRASGSPRSWAAPWTFRTGTFCQSAPPRRAGTFARSCPWPSGRRTRRRRRRRRPCTARTRPWRPSRPDVPPCAETFPRSYPPAWFFFFPTTLRLPTPSLSEKFWTCVHSLVKTVLFVNKEKKTREKQLGRTKLNVLRQPRRIKITIFWAGTKTSEHGRVYVEKLKKAYSSLYTRIKVFLRGLVMRQI